MLSILKICEIRATLNKDDPKVSEDQAPSSPIPSNAFIIRQLKREEEISLFKRIYGRRFVQVSVTVSEATQLSRVSQIVAAENPGLLFDDQRKNAEEMIKGAAFLGVAWLAMGYPLFGLASLPVLVIGMRIIWGVLTLPPDERMNRLLALA